MQEITNIITGSSLSILTIFAGIVVKLVKDYLLKKGGEKAVKIAEIVAKTLLKQLNRLLMIKTSKALKNSQKQK
ncbi:phage holin domain protein [Streptococcus ictaluri 707-05]|uniref:Phage holin domain protein n=1 Tax=Streptococcus ictaluri 707-05 TaxID=764299 RepID=G5K086_9STRE|nr:phage holin domain protein [Streptococcus ictaluri 707-05]